ncbi:bile acid:sodium symporter family protein [Chloroflexota bacterium]
MLSVNKNKIVFRQLFRNQSFIFILGIVLALTIGQGAVWTEPLLIPALAVAMTLSTLGITNENLVSIRKSPRTVLISLLLNYAVMSTVLLLMSWRLIDDSELWKGFVTMASVPPAISVTPITYALGGNTLISLIGTTGLYLIALGLTPGIMIIFLGTDLISPLMVLLTLTQLIIVPLLISRLLRFKGLDKHIDKWRDTAVNWCFFVVIFTVIGLNRQAFFEQPSTLFQVIVIAITVTFGLGHVVGFIATKLNVDRETNISYMLMSSRKNSGLASAVALSFFSRRAAFPAAIVNLIGLLCTVWWSYYFKKVLPNRQLRNS